MPVSQPPSLMNCRLLLMMNSSNPPTQSDAFAERPWLHFSSEPSIHFRTEFEFDIEPCPQAHVVQSRPRLHWLFHSSFPFLFTHNLFEVSPVEWLSFGPSHSQCRAGFSNNHLFRFLFFFQTFFRMGSGCCWMVVGCGSVEMVTSCRDAISGESRMRRTRCVCHNRATSKSYLIQNMRIVPHCVVSLLYPPAFQSF